MNEAAPIGQPRLDVILALRCAVLVFWRDAAAIVLAGLLLVTLPGAVAKRLPAANDWGTITATLRGVFAMLYVALVSWGVAARLAGRPLPPRQYIAQGVARATPGMKVALLIGAAVVAGLTLQLFARHGTFDGWLLNALLLMAGLFALTAVMPAVPVAVVERLGPLAALRRAAALTAGNRDRILALILLVGLTLAPSVALVSGIAGPDTTGGGLIPMVWPVFRAIFELIVWSLAAAVPAVVYGLLREPAQDGLRDVR